jgi:hypothetical protein
VSTRKYGNTVNVVIGDTEIKYIGYGSFPTISLVCHSHEWRIETSTNTHVCVDISIFLLIRSHKTSFVGYGKIQVLSFMVLVW